MRGNWCFISSHLLSVHVQTPHHHLRPEGAKTKTPVISLCLFFSNFFKFEFWLVNSTVWVSRVDFSDSSLPDNTQRSSQVPSLGPTIHPAHPSPTTLCDLIFKEKVMKESRSQTKGCWPGANLQTDTPVPGILGGQAGEPDKASAFEVV